MPRKTRPGDPPTPDQAAVLDYIRAAYLRDGRSPSFPEIRAHFGYRSPNSVEQFVRHLVAKGVIRRGGPHAARSLVPADCSPPAASLPAGWEGAGPSPRQLDTLRAIVAHRAAHGVSPTVRELCAVLGITPNAAHGHVKRLVAKGLLKWDRNRARSLVPVAPAEVGP